MIKKWGCSILLLSLVLAISPPQTSAWGLSTHQTIADQALDLLPQSLQNFVLQHRAAIMDASIQPDLRKGSDPAEGPRHYDDQDVPHKDHNISTSSPDYRDGVVSWAVEFTTHDLITALQHNKTAAIIRYMGDLTHYIADASQPFHSTKNYDGQLTGNNGIHARYENTMINRYKSELFNIQDFEALKLIDQPYNLSETEIHSGLALVPQLLKADDNATASSGSTSSGDYYQALYEMTKSITQDRLKMAIQNTANLWFTAFYHAGWGGLNGEPTFAAGDTTGSTTAPTPVMTGIFLGSLLVIPYLRKWHTTYR